MKKIDLIIVLLVSLPLNYLFSQDIIVLKNGDEIKSKVLEINDKDIKYKKFDNLDGPTIATLKSDIFMIKYQNGTREVINTNTSAKSDESKKSKKHVDSKPNRVGFYVNPLGFLEFGPMLGPEITINSRLIIDGSLRLFSLGALAYVTEADDGAPDKISGAGLGAGLKYFIPSRIGGFYVGGLFEYAWWTSYYASGKPTAWQKDKTTILAMATIGYKFRFKSGFFINTGGMIGIQYPLENQWHSAYSSLIHENNKSIDPAGMFEVSFGFEF